MKSTILVENSIAISSRLDIYPTYFLGVACFEFALHLHLSKEVHQIRIADSFLKEMLQFDVGECVSAVGTRMSESDTTQSEYVNWPLALTEHDTGKQN